MMLHHYLIQCLPRFYVVLLVGMLAGVGFPAQVCSQGQPDTSTAQRRHVTQMANLRIKNAFRYLEESGLDATRPSLTRRHEVMYHPADVRRNAWQSESDGVPAADYTSPNDAIQAMNFYLGIALEIDTMMGGHVLSDSVRALAHFYIGMLSRNHKDAEGSTAERDSQYIVQLHKSLALNPTYAPAHFQLGIAYARLGQWPAAAQAYDRAAALDTTLWAARLEASFARDEMRRLAAPPRDTALARQYALRALVYQSMGNHTEMACANLTHALELGGPAPHLQLLRGVALLQIGKPNAAYEDIRQALGQPAPSQLSESQIEEWLRLTSETDVAYHSAVYLPAPDTNPNPVAKWEWLQQYPITLSCLDSVLGRQSIRQPEQAIRRQMADQIFALEAQLIPYAKSLKVWPFLALKAAYWQMANMHPTQSEEWLTEYLQSDSLRAKDPRVLESRGQARALARNFAGALEDYNHALLIFNQQCQQTGQDCMYLNRRIVALKAEVLVQMGDTLAAEQLLEAYAQTDIAMLNDRARTRLAAGDTTGALADMAAVIASDTRFAKSALVMRGHLYLRIGSYTQAEADFTRLINESEDYKSSSYLYRALCHLELGNPTAACEDYAQYKATHPPNRATPHPDLLARFAACR